MSDNQPTVTFPYPGAVLNHQHGRENIQSLFISVTGRAAPGAQVFVNGILANRANGTFCADVALTASFNTLRVTAGGTEQIMTVVWDRGSFKRYNFFIDDNIFFLTELYRTGARSLFDQFYLARLLALHKRYGTKFVLNIFFRNDHDPFLLSEFPDKYKCEWADNADWLKLTFHAYSEFPDWPYRDRFPEQLPEHYNIIREQVLRFAGAQSFCPPSIVHFYEVVSPASRRFLRANGTAALAVRNFPEAATQARAAILYEADPGWFMMPVDFFCNLRTIPQIEDDLRRHMACPWKQTINIGTHEQYCYPFYARYIPDHFDRMETAVRLVTEGGYQPTFFHEDVLGNCQRPGSDKPGTG